MHLFSVCKVVSLSLLLAMGTVSRPQSCGDDCLKQYGGMLVPVNNPNVKVVVTLRTVIASVAGSEVIPDMDETSCWRRRTRLEPGQYRGAGNSLVLYLLYAAPVEISGG
ncbi:hypothetical protein BDP27DRAFT_1371881 [Rhodocollybia butyracea]|uniref:Uncharacterized protein n=1 Tax=Rhodocollybia butyracea TaxID=206335 RepID=A0A9P5P8X4_9AGAR|nr:hypothetical protein BDP27DRAFT_1371881 [Rhodocollybia butyracea]